MHNEMLSSVLVFIMRSVDKRMVILLLSCPSKMQRLAHEDCKIPLKRPMQVLGLIIQDFRALQDSACFY